MSNTYYFCILSYSVLYFLPFYQEYQFVSFRESCTFLFFLLKHNAFNLLQLTKNGKIGTNCSAATCFPNMTWVGILFVRTENACGFCLIKVELSVRHCQLGTTRNPRVQSGVRCRNCITINIALTRIAKHVPAVTIHTNYISHICISHCAKLVVTMCQDMQHQCQRCFPTSS